MARTISNTVEYFPHPCDHGRKMFIIEKKYGNDGYAVWFKLLEQIGSTEGHLIEYQDETTRIYLASICNISEQRLDEIVEQLVKIDAIQKTEKGQIGSLKFIENIREVYRKRGRIGKIDSVAEMLISVAEKKLLSQKSKDSGKTVAEIPQSKVKESKVKESKEKKGVVFPFDSKEFLAMWDLWKQYKKKEFRFTYKSELSEQAALKKLAKISGGDEKISIKIILQSIENSWKGFFALSEEKSKLVKTKNLQDEINEWNNA